MKTMTAKTSSWNDEAETVLVVDDDAEIRKLEGQFLSRLGYKVLQAPGPVEALRLAAVTPAIDLLVTDFDMPETNGLELARLFRAMHPEASVLMVSGSLHELNGHAQDLDRFAFLAKPFTRDELMDKVYTLLTCHKRSLADSLALQPSLQTGSQAY